MLFGRVDCECGESFFSDVGERRKRRQDQGQDENNSASSRTKCFLPFPTPSTALAYYHCRELHDNKITGEMPKEWSTMAYVFYM